MSARSSSNEADAGGAESGGPGPEVHLCDNYSHLLRASADLAGRKGGAATSIVLFIDDHLPLDHSLRQELESLTGIRIRCVSDLGAIAEFSRLPHWVPDMLRRNLSWHNCCPVTPFRWAPRDLRNRQFEVAFVYHPGFFLSKVVAGRSQRVIMRDSGYANYVYHRVPKRRKALRLLAGRSPLRQVWGEERWVDAIEVVRPDQLPRRARHKGSKLTLDQLMNRLPRDQSRQIARAFWGSGPVLSIDNSTALLVTQPIEQLGICSPTEKRQLYSQIVARLRALNFNIVVKPHPRETLPPLPGEVCLPAAFPIEAWTWLDQPQFDLAISLNSAALADSQVSFAARHLQLVPPSYFFAEYWNQWPSLIEASFVSWGANATDGC